MKILKWIRIILLSFFILSCSGILTDVGNGSSGTKEGTLRIRLISENNFVPEYYRITISQGEKIIKESEGKGNTRDYVFVLTYGEYSIAIKALNAEGQTLLEKSESLRVDSEIKALFYSFGQDSSLVALAIGEQFPQVIQQVKLSIENVESYLKVVNYKNGENILLNDLSTGEYHLKLEFQDVQGITYFTKELDLVVGSDSKVIPVDSIVQNKVTPLSFSLDAERVALNSLLTIQCNTKESKIYYTLDGTAPSENSSVYPSEGIRLTKNVTVTAVGMKENLENSPIIKRSFIVDENLIFPPSITPDSGSYTPPLVVEMESDLDNSEVTTIYYTTDGSEPTKSSTVYQNNFSLTEEGEYTVKAVSYTNDGLKSSSVISREYILEYDTVSAPIISPNGGDFVSSVTITIASATPGASIYYTLDGSQPSASSTLYTGPFSLEKVGTTAIKAVAVKNGFKNSAVTTSVFTGISQLLEVETPIFSPMGGTFSEETQVSITTATDGASIYYTLDGTQPSASSTQYLAPFLIRDTATIKALAVKSGYRSSSIAEATFTKEEKVFDGITILVAKNLGYNKIHYWSCSDMVAYPNTTWPGTDMTENGSDYQYQFAGSSSVSILITKSSGDKLCNSDMEITEKGTYRVTSKGFTKEIPQKPELVISPSNGTVSFTGSFTIHVTSTTSLISAEATINGSRETLSSGLNSFKVSDYVSQSGASLSITATATNSIGAASASAFLTATENSITLSGNWNELRMYQVMVSSFQDGDSRIGYGTGYGPGPHNGDLQGIINALDYIQDLGMNALWMTPIFNSNGGGQLDSTGYYTYDYFNVDPKFGTNEKFRELVNACHERGMYVILDGVFGHWGNAVVASPTGKKPARSKDMYQACDYPASLEFFKEVATYWIENYGIDGWRLDQCYQVGLGENGNGNGDNCYTNGRNYWYDIRKAVEAASDKRKNNGEAWGTLGYMVGEHWKGDAATIQRGSINPGSAEGYGLRSCFDFPSRYKLVQIFATEESKNIGGIPLTNIDYVFKGYSEKGYTHPEGYWPNLFLTNHDLVRFGNLIQWKYGENKNSNNYWKRHKLALSSLAAYTGPITVYYGDEYGAMLDGYTGSGSMGYYNDNVARDAGKIGGFNANEQGLHDYVASLMKAREENEALWNGTHTTLSCENSFYAGKKVKGSNTVVFLINSGSSSRSYHIGTAGTDLVTGNATSSTVTVEGLSSMFVRLN